MARLIDYIKDPKNILFSFLYHSYSFLPDKLCVKWQYRAFIGRRLNLKNPQRFSEKLQWLKLYYHDPVLPIAVDKVTAKDYVAERIGKEHVIETYGVWSHFDDIDFDSLPDSFVLKTNHTGGGDGILICRNKSEFDIDNARAVLEKNLSINMYNSTREWPYKHIRPKIIAERLLKPSLGDDVYDYKIFCFGGEPKLLMVATNRFTTHNFNFFDLDFNPVPFVSCSGQPVDDPSIIAKPAKFDEMVQIARVLSAPFPHVRVDLYYSEDTVYFGELTFYQSGGYENMHSDEADLLLGSWINLPDKIL